VATCLARGQYHTVDCKICLNQTLRTTAHDHRYYQRIAGLPQNVSPERRGGRSRLSPAGSLMVTRVRQPEAVRTALVTVLFADLRGYTGMAERLPAARVVPLLEEFFRVLASATETYGGTVF